MPRLNQVCRSITRLLIHSNLVVILFCSQLVGCTFAHAQSQQYRGKKSKTIDVIAFGSCAREDRAQPIWQQIVAQRPDLFLFIGDNVYADIPDSPRTVGDIAAAYRELDAKLGYRKLRQTCPILATWDDHDYGLNDAGREFNLKRQSQQMLLTFFREPADSLRWTREGVYGAWQFGPPEKTVQILLLDTRYFRDSLKQSPEHREGMGPYVPDEDPSKQLLGEDQWMWLEEHLKKPADVRIIGSSIQVVSDEHGWECWANMPHERKRLYDLIAKTKAGGIFFISGDRHLIEISRDQEEGTPYPMIDFTSSGFNWEKSEVTEANRFRVSPLLRQPNFGVIRIDWNQAQPIVKLEGRSGTGAMLMSYEVSLDELQVQ